MKKGCCCADPVYTNIMYKYIFIEIYAHIYSYREYYVYKSRKCYQIFNVGGRYMGILYIIISTLI